MPEPVLEQAAQFNQEGRVESIELKSNNLGRWREHG